MTTPEIIVAMKSEIRKLTAALAILEGTARTVTEISAESAENPKRNGKRRMSPAARKRIAEAQKERWAKFHAEQGNPEPAPKKRRLSAAGRKRIAEASKARWAKFRADQAKAKRKAA